MNKAEVGRTRMRIEQDRLGSLTKETIEVLIEKDRATVNEGGSVMTEAS